MAYDLIFGSTNRDWSCGAYIDSYKIPGYYEQPGSNEQLYRKSSPQELGDIVRKEAQTNYDLVFRLTNQKKLPDGERKEFGKFLKKWVDYAGTKNHRYTESDTVNLMNFHIANQRFTDRLKKYSSNLDSGPKNISTVPKTEEKAMVQFRPPGIKDEKPSFPFGLLSILGLGFGLLGFVLGTRKR